MRLEAILKRIAKQFGLASRMGFGIDNDLIKSETLKLDDNNNQNKDNLNRMVSKCAFFFV